MTGSSPERRSSHRSPSRRRSLSSCLALAASPGRTVGVVSCARPPGVNASAEAARQASLLAARRTAALLERGDVDGQRVWKPALRAVQELIRTARKPHEQLTDNATLTERFRGLISARYPQ